MIDASAVLVVCHKEPGAAEALQLKRHGLITSVNLSEVLQRGLEYDRLRVVQSIIPTADLRVVHLDEELAIRTAELAQSTRKKGISFAVILQT